MAAQIATLRQTLQTLVTAISTLPTHLASSATLPTQDITIDWPVLRDAVSELSHLLEACDMDAQECFNKIRDPLYQVSPSAARRIERHIEDFAFDQALMTLHALQSRHPELQLNP